MQRKGTVAQSTLLVPTSMEAGRAPEVREYPSCDGKPMAQNNRQLRVITSTVETLATHFRHHPDVHVRADFFIYYDILREGEDPHTVSVVPDVFVVLGDVEVPQSSYKIWEVGIVPQFVMEVASRSTYERDRYEKPAIYERLGVEEYWLVEPTGELLRGEDAGRMLMAWRLDPVGVYQRVEAGLEGGMRSEILDLDLFVVEGRLRFWDSERGQFLEDQAELADSRQAAEQRAEAAESELARLRELVARMPAGPNSTS